MKAKVLFLLVCLIFTCKKKSSINPSNTTDATIIANSSIRIDKEEGSDSLNLQAIIKKAINLPELQQYYHISELPNRSPLLVYLPNDIFYNVELFKFGKKVELTNDIKVIEGKPHLKFNTITVNKDSADVDFLYDVEGIRVLLKMKKSNTNWTIIESIINEN